MNTKKNTLTLAGLRTIISIVGILAAIVITIVIPIMPRKPPETTRVIKVTTSKLEAYYDLELLIPTSDTSSFNESGETLRLEFPGIENGWIEVSGHSRDDTDDIIITAKILAMRNNVNVVTPEELTLYTENPPDRLNLDNKTVIRLSRTG